MNIYILEQLIKKKAKQKDLAKFCGWSNATLSEKISRNRFSTKDLVKIAEFFGKRVEIHFVDDTDDDIVQIKTNSVQEEIKKNEPIRRKDGLLRIKDYYLWKYGGEIELK